MEGLVSYSSGGLLRAEEGGISTDVDFDNGACLVVVCADVIGSSGCASVGS